MLIFILFPSSFSDVFKNELLLYFYDALFFKIYKLYQIPLYALF